MAVKKVIKEKERWLVDYNQNTICRLEKGARLYTGAGDGLFGSFEEAQSYLFAVLRHKQAQAIADIERLSAELKVIEAKINTIHLSKKK